MIGGQVDPKALYWFVDDCISTGSTLRNYLDYIESNNGAVGAVTMLSKRTRGNEHLLLQRETLNAFNVIFENSPEAKQELVNTLYLLGIKFSFANPALTTATNQEVLLLAGYFADPYNPDHYDAMNKALMAIGVSVDEANKSYPVKAFWKPKGNIFEFNKELKHQIVLKPLSETKYFELSPHLIIAL